MVDETNRHVWSDRDVRDVRDQRRWRATLFLWIARGSELTCREDTHRVSERRWEGELGERKKDRYWMGKDVNMDVVVDVVVVVVVDGNV